MLFNFTFGCLLKTNGNLMSLSVPWINLTINMTNPLENFIYMYNCNSILLLELQKRIQRRSWGKNIIPTGKNRSYDAKILLILAKTEVVMQKYYSYCQKQKVWGKHIIHTVKNRRYEVKILFILSKTEGIWGKNIIHTDKTEGMR